MFSFYGVVLDFLYILPHYLFENVKMKKAFSVVASLVRVHLISMLDVSELLRSTRRGYHKARESPPGSLQLSLFGVKTGRCLF